MSRRDDKITLFGEGPSSVTGHVVQDKSQQQAAQKANKSSKVVLYFWPSFKQAAIRIVAPETEIYLSLWSKDTNLVSDISSKHTQTFADDVKKFGKPSTVICLYTLKTADMIAKYNEIKETAKDWTRLGQNIYQCADCANFIWRLLRSGNILSLSSNSSVKLAKDGLKNFAESLKAIKEVEIQLHPDTSGLAHMGNHPQDRENSHNSESSENCFIM